MDVEQTIRILRLLREGCAVWPSDRRKAINNAIAIIKAAQEFKQAREDALEPQTITLKVDEMEGREDDH